MAGSVATRAAIGGVGVLVRFERGVVGAAVDSTVGPGADASPRRRASVTAA